MHINYVQSGAMALALYGHADRAPTIHTQPNKRQHHLS